MKLNFCKHAMIMVALLILTGCQLPDNEAESFDDVYDKLEEKAKEAQRIQDYQAAEKYYLIKIDEVRKRQLDEGYYNSPDYERLARFVYLPQGRYDEAADAENKFYELFKNKMVRHEVFWHYGYLSQIYGSKGQYDDARHAVEWLITNADNDVKVAMEDKKNKNDHIPLMNAKAVKFTNAYPNIANYYNTIGDPEKSIKLLQGLVEHSNSVRLMPQNRAKVNNYLATAYYYAGDDVKAEKLFADAAGLNSSAAVGFPQDLSYSYMMLGRIAEHKNDYVAALKSYRTAIAALNMYTKLLYKVEQADVCNEIGRCQLRQGKTAEARAAYTEAIELRKKTTTTTHPNYADALRGLAGVTLCEGNIASATLQAEESLKILDAALVPTHPRITATLIALTSIYEQTGKSEQAAPLKARIETILQKPLGPWKEDFMETAAFYTEQLKKANKPAAAQYLEQLHARQKDKR
ncbi:tetratricopeptide repeat protein [bacterium]|nr:tetratricopeptide repeat protein [bacterium]